MCCWGHCTCNERVDLRDARKFTMLLIHVATTSHTALQDSDLFALVLVKKFFHKYTKFYPTRVDEYAHKFKRMGADSRLEIAFKGKCRGLRALPCKVFTNDNPIGAVVFDVQTRIVRQYITPGCTYKDLKIQMTDFLSAYSGELIEREPCSKTSQCSGCSPPHRYY